MGEWSLAKKSKMILPNGAAAIPNPPPAPKDPKTPAEKAEIGTELFLHFELVFVNSRADIDYVVENAPDWRD